MAETSEKVILSVVLDYGDAVKETAALKKEWMDANAVLKQLEAETGKATEEYVAQEAVVKSLSESYKQQNKALNDSVKIRTAATGSIQQQRTELSKMTADYIKLSKAERESASGKELLTKIRSTSDELKGLEKAMGDNRRNVGNYAAVLDGLTTNLKIGGVNIGQLKSGFSGVTDVIKGSGAQFASFNGILKASAIGVVITLIAGLVAAFMKFQPYVDKLEQVFGGLNQVLDVFVGRLIRVGQGLVAIASGDFSGGIDKIRDSFKGVADEMKNAYDAGTELVKLQQDIDDANRQNIITNSQLNKEIEQLLLKAKNRSLSERERLKLLDEASKKEKQQFENKRAVAEMELKKAQQEYDLAVRNQTLNDAIEDKRANAIAKINDLESESINLQEKIQNRRDALIEAETAKRKAAADKAVADAKKAEDAILKAREESIKRNQELSQQAEDYRTQKAKEAAEEIKFVENERTTALTNSLTNNLITQQQYEEQLLQIKLDSLEKEKALAEQQGEDLTSIELAIAQQKLAIKQNEVETKKAFNEADIKSSVAVANAAQDVIGQLASAAGQGTALQKQLALTNVAINLGTAIGNLVATTSAPSPDNLLTGGIAGFVKYAGFLAQVIGSITQAQNIIGGAAAGGGDFMTTGPTLLLVGDNPGGVEQVSVKPISGKGKTTVNPNSGLIAMAGGGTLTTYGGYAARNGMQNAVPSNNREPIQVVTRITDIIKLNKSIEQATEISELS